MNLQFDTELPMFTTTTQYALRALVAMSSLPHGDVILGRDLSAKSGVPANYLSKILLDLKRAGIVTAVRGTGGGYRLNRSADEVRLVEVVSLFDPPRANPGCLLASEGECSDNNPCAAHERWCRVRSTYESFLESTTVAEFAKPEKGKDKNADKT
jgi:Rrf2 family iron-sulfur cluster assembly transcriptional regulator